MDEKCSQEVALDEDSCLHACLVDKFVATAGCLHPRLKVLLDEADVMADGAVSQEDKVDVCSFNNLSNLRTRNLQAEETDQEGNEIDPGKIKINSNVVSLRILSSQRFLHLL